MTPTILQHPLKEQLVAFGLGRLDSDQSTDIERHLEACPDCCETMLDLADDTFVGLVRQCEVPADGMNLSGATLAPGASAAADGLPPALAAHDRYEILELVGRGGMGDVYRAQHKLMNRQVALKVIKPQLVKSEAAVERFRREVQAAARLHHKHIVTAHDADKAGDLHFLVMEFVEGVNLDEVVRRRGKLPVAEACEYIRQAAEGLQHAHELGMVHRDIKPHNLMVSAAGQVKILDFGLAGFATEVAEEQVRTESDESKVETAAALHQLTQMGTMMGTPDYIAPEQAANAHQADIRADIYSLGCTLFTLLAGRAPFGEGTVLEKIKAHAEQDPPAISQFRSDVPAEVQSILDKMLAKDPAERYQTPAEAAAALAPCVQRQAGPQSTRPQRAPRSGRTWPLAAAMGLLLAGIAAAAIYYIQTDYGVVRVEIADPNLEVNLAGNTITAQNDGQPLTIHAGKQKLIVRSGRFKFESESFQLRRKGEVVLKVEYLAGEYIVLKDGKPFGPRVRPEGPAPATAPVVNDGKQPSEFFTSLGDLQAIVRKTLTDEGLSVGQMEPGAQVAGPRRLIVLNAEATGERDDGKKALTALRDKFKALAGQTDAFVSSLDQEMRGGVAATNLPYTTPSREGQIRVEMRQLGTDKREPSISQWRLVIQVEEWLLSKAGSQSAAAPGNQSDTLSLYFQRLAGAPLESVVRERVGGGVGKRITSERIPQPAGRLRYEATIDGVGSKIIDNVFVDLRDVLMQGTGARFVHHGEQGLALRLLRYTTPTHNGEVRLTLNSREVGGRPADESTKWLLKIEASEWVKGASQGTPAVIRVEHSGGGTTLYLDGTPLSRDELLARLDALAAGDPGFQVRVEGDVVPVSKEVLELMEAVGASAVGASNVKFPSEVTQRLMDDALQRGQQRAGLLTNPPMLPPGGLPAGRNLIADPSLEETPAGQLPKGWFAWLNDEPGFKCEVVEGGVTGKHCLQISGTGTRGVVFATSIPLDRTKRYALKGRVKVEGEAGTWAVVKLNYFSKEGWLGVDDRVGVTTGDLDWKLLEKTDAAEKYPTATLIVPTCHIEGNGTAWFDDLEVIAYDREKLPADFDATHGKNNRMR